ncbi:MAG: damage-control phosphatase ARMT1 family protein [Bacteroidota bacterium]
MDPKCLFCFSRAFEKLLDQHISEKSEQYKMSKKFFGFLSGIDTDQPTPLIAREIHAMIRNYLNEPDPYKQQKEQSNKQAKALVEGLRKKLNASDDPDGLSLRYAIAGNIIDYGPGHKFDIEQTISHLEEAKLAIDHSNELIEKIKKANKILYLGDNAGEIVFDKLFLETIDHPNVTFVTRGAPVINDVTREEAREVGMHKVAKVIDNGYDAPSTVLDKSNKAFLEEYQSADLIIAKGQGNFEGLMHEDDPRLWFLLMVKCDVIGTFFGLNKGDIVVSNNHR